MKKLKKIIPALIWTIFGVVDILRYFKTGDKFLLWTGLAIGLVNLIIIIYYLINRQKRIEV